MSATAPSPHRAAIPALLALVQLAFASLSIVGKVTLGAVSPLALVQCRLLGGALCFGALGLLARRPLVPPRGARGELALLALLGLVANQVLFLYGLQRTSAIEGTLMIATIPVVTVLYAVLSGRERGRLTLWLGLALALGGALTVALSRGGTTQGAHLVGDLLVLANCASYGAYLVRARDAVARFGSERVVLWIFLFAAAMVAPAGIPTLLSEAPSYPPRVWLAIAYITAGPTVFAYGANAWALQRAPSSLVAVFIYVQPVLAVLLSLTLGDRLARWLAVPSPHESITLTLLLGMSAILGGVTLASRKKTQEKS